MSRLKEVLAKFDYNKITTDSKVVRKGDLFIAINGTRSDGHDYVGEALNRGAKAIILQRDLDTKGSPKIIVKNTRKALAFLAKEHYQDPSKKIKVIGVTGTNGKTTVSYMVESILRRAGLKAGLIGTVCYKIDKMIVDSENTTPSPMILQGLLKKMVDCSLNYCVMEVSSHALDQHRADYIAFRGGIFTNATREHLDYHKTFKKYLKSKLSLFESLPATSYAILNKDDPNFKEVKAACNTKRIASYSIKKGADVYAEQITYGLDGSTFLLHAGGKAMPIKTPFIGQYNISNMLAALSCAIMEGVSLNMIKSALAKEIELPGRLELVDRRGPIKVFIDYAHTDDALSKVLYTLSRLKERRIITVFGCGGNRDKAKRPRMGSVCTAYSDHIFVTSDNPREEDPKDIANDIVKGIRGASKSFKVVLDRRQAIEEAIEMADDRDIVLIAGKGHEKYQIIGKRHMPFDDKEIASECLEKRSACLI